MADDKFAVHDITVYETPIVTLAGRIERHTIVRYFIGDSGPFQDPYPSAAYTPEVGRAGIEKRIRELRAVHAPFGS